MALSIWVPIGYIGALILSLSLFSSVYRRRSAKNLAKESLDPWHPEGHPERDVYQSLISLSQTESIPDHVLKAALLSRAMTDVKRIVQMREDKQALSILLQKGSIGDETTARFNLAEKELEAEILDVVSEANTFRQGWGQLIFPTASEMATHFKHKEIYYGIPEQRKQQADLLSSQGKSLPKPTIELPPLFTPPGTQISVPQQAAQQQQQQPPQISQPNAQGGPRMIQPGQPIPQGAVQVQLPPNIDPAQFAQLPPQMQQQLLQRILMMQQQQQQQQSEAQESSSS
ncbi:unnamed protein product [Sympodiomycopsis kandeliae]